MANQNHVLILYAHSVANARFLFNSSSREWLLAPKISIFLNENIVSFVLHIIHAIDYYFYQLIHMFDKKTISSNENKH